MKAKNWIKEINENPDWNIVSIDQDAVNEISELIEKATPKKPIFYEEYCAKCPACGHLYEEGIDDYGADYCIMCGQRLDWGEKDEK